MNTKEKTSLEWCNNLISRKLAAEYPHDFSICDIDGLTRCYYDAKTGEKKNRIILYESKNEHEKESFPQMTTLRILNNAVDWTQFDSLSGMYVIRIIDIENELHWFNLSGDYVRKTTFPELHQIISAQEARL